MNLEKKVHLNCKIISILVVPLGQSSYLYGTNKLKIEIMKTIEFKQSKKVGVAGSFINQMMGNNTSLPEVGKGATLLHYSDRTCYEVLEVSEDRLTARLEALDAEWDKSLGGGEGHQNWILKPTGNFCTVVWRNNAWRIKRTEITFTKAFKEEHKDAISFARLLTEKQRIAVYQGKVRPVNVVEGITERKTVYHKISILFGVKDYYYDWSF
jgi:hypothetical protein